jgi:hypothetical protein
MLFDEKNPLICGLTNPIKLGILKLSQYQLLFNLNKMMMKPFNVDGSDACVYTLTTL